jgi:hypothetical protein
VKLTTSPCKKKFIENLLRKKILDEAKTHLYGCRTSDDDEYFVKNKKSMEPLIMQFSPASRHFIQNSYS